MNVGERIKKVRQAEKLTQQKFAEHIGTTQNTITRYESGVREPPHAVIALICRTFNVREEWLRTGGGEMYENVDASILSQLRARYGLNDRQLALVENYLSLPDKMRDAVVDIAKHLAAEPPAAAKIAAPGKPQVVVAKNATTEAVPGTKGEGQEKPPEGKSRIDLMVDAYRAELEAEEAAKGKSLASPVAKSNTAIA